MKRGRGSSQRTLALIVVLLAFVVWRLGMPGPPEAPPPPDLKTTPFTSRNVAPWAGYLAPDFQAVDLQGHPVNLFELRGRVVFLNFWATWCIPCREELPAIGRLAARLPGNVSIVTIATDSQAAEVRRTMREQGLGFPVILDDSGMIAAKYQLAGIPTSLLLDPRGIIVKRISGARAWDRPQFAAWLGRLATEVPSAARADSDKARADEN